MDAVARAQDAYKKSKVGGEQSLKSGALRPLAPDDRASARDRGKDAVRKRAGRPMHGGRLRVGWRTVPPPRPSRAREAQHDQGPYQ